MVSSEGGHKGRPSFQGDRKGRPYYITKPPLDAYSFQGDHKGQSISLNEKVGHRAVSCRVGAGVVGMRGWDPCGQYISLHEKVCEATPSSIVGAGVVGMRGWDPCGRPSVPQTFPLK